MTLPAGSISSGHGVKLNPWNNTRKTILSLGQFSYYHNSILEVSIWTLLSAAAYAKLRKNPEENFPLTLSSKRLAIPASIYNES